MNERCRWRCRASISHRLNPTRYGNILLTLPKRIEVAYRRIKIRIVVPALTGNLADAERLRDRRPPTDMHAIPRSR